MISYKLLREIMPVTEEENRIIRGGSIERDLYMSGGSDVINSKLLLEKGKLISVRPHTRFADFPEHSHDFIEVVYMCLGSTTHIINGKEVLLSEGELLFQHLMNCTDSISYANEEDELVVKFLRYIDDNYRDASLSEAAKLLFCDSSWLSREIKKRTGKNYTDLIRERRLAQAVFYLKNTNMKISQIVPAIGYDNVSYFYRIFFEAYNMTPKQLRGANKDKF